MNVLASGDVVAQLAHVGWGAFLALAFALWLPVWEAALLAAFIGFGKEALEALGWALWEPKQTWPSSWRDFEFWLIGVALAFALAMLVKR